MTPKNTFCTFSTVGLVKRKFDGDIFYSIIDFSHKNNCFAYTGKYSTAAQECSPVQIFNLNWFEYFEYKDKSDV